MKRTMTTKEDLEHYCPNCLMLWGFCKCKQEEISSGDGKRGFN